MEGKKGSRMAIIILVFLFLAGCAGIPVREEVKVDLKAPVGKIEGNQFTGIRYPFNVSAPPGWQVTTKFPEFMLKLGFDKEGLESPRSSYLIPTRNQTFRSISHRPTVIPNGTRRKSRG